MKQIFYKFDLNLLVFNQKKKSSTIEIKYPFDVDQKNKTTIQLNHEYQIEKSSMKNFRSTDLTRHIEAKKSYKRRKKKRKTN